MRFKGSENDFSLYLQAIVYSGEFWYLISDPSFGNFTLPRLSREYRTNYFSELIPALKWYVEWDRGYVASDHMLWTAQRRRLAL